MYAVILLLAGCIGLAWFALSGDGAASAATRDRARPHGDALARFEPVAAAHRPIGWGRTGTKAKGGNDGDGNGT